MNKRIFALPAAALTALVLAGCGSDDTPAAAPASATTAAAPSTSASAGVSAEHNAADIMFAQMMIPHHRQAIDMAKMASTRASSADVKALATKIWTAQDPEIQTMSTWLLTWKAAVPTGMPGMDMGDGGMSMPSMPGAMSDADMKKLESLSGAAFDKEFLTMMTAHHKGAIQMAQEEQKNGKNPEAVALAGKIVTDQTAEIAEIQKLLNAS